MYYEHIDLTTTQEIIDYFSPIIEKYKNTTENMVEWLDESYNDWLNERISLKEYTGKDNKVIGAFIFAVVPNNDPPVYHIDGDGTGDYPYETPCWALNIPLYNCDQGEMIWATGQYSTRVVMSEHNIPYLELIWNSDPEVVETAVINSPTIVKIDIPHKVINHKDAVRMMLTIRFDPDIF
jgi:hypothetical protein